MMKLALIFLLQQVPSVEIENAFPNLPKLRLPLYLTHPKDGTDRLFVLEQDGRVLWFENKRDVSAYEVALDIRQKVRRSHMEEGLLGLAFHPKFKDNGYVYLQYSASKPRRNVISRFTMDKDRKTMAPDSEKMIVEIPQPYGNHNGGGLEFGPDGFLYIGLGDGGDANDPHDNGQKMNTFLGKMLRIDIDKEESGKAYAVPKDNPFYGRENTCWEIWALGLRNPWRYSFDRKTGELWAGDVGQDSWEEIDIIKKGGNYGWNFREGKHDFKRGGRGPYEEPVIEHNRREARSITGGYVYRGKKVKGLDGVYLYADFVTGNIWGLRWDGKKVASHKLLGTNQEISSFGEDKDGEVYFTSFTGKIFKFR
jgi:glucose/arabinose dehydrogenase